MILTKVLNLLYCSDEDQIFTSEVVLISSLIFILCLLFFRQHELWEILLIPQVSNSYNSKTKLYRKLVLKNHKNTLFLKGFEAEASLAVYWPSAIHVFGKLKNFLWGL